MSRYFVNRKTRASYLDYDYPLIADIHVSEHVAQPTGLLDKNDDEIMRAPNPIGFHHWK